MFRNDNIEMFATVGDELSYSTKSMTTFNQARIIFLLICAEWCIVQACRTTEYMFWCHRNDYIPGVMCPGVQPWQCEKSKFRCACKEGTAQRWDAYCVPYRDCVFRAFYPEKLLMLDEDLIMVGLSTSIFEKDTLKCFVSSPFRRGSHKFHRLVKYKKKVGNQWQDMQFDLNLYTSVHYGETLLVKDAWTSLPYGIEDFPSLHADEDCIILGKMPPYGQKTECTYWVRRSVVGNRNWRCDFLFDNFCKSQAIVINEKNLNQC
ncbi:uncharacterized protein [Dermacentor andersoni]|uniref:uncharacterized protein isoform X2 n=1 Tax=Dermacentor andersoni TaxID=34620 RepID=UPI00241763E1|nr:uncharacterized protein LOC126534729 isoform X2 [Dermacentor andersoni]